MESLAHLALRVGFLRGVFYTEIGVKFLLMASTVMLADDDPVLLGEAADALRDAGFRVIEAADGQEALQEALNRRVDLIVMDASMPEVDGLEEGPGLPQAGREDARIRAGPAQTFPARRAGLSGQAARQAQVHPALVVRRSS